MRTLTAVWPDGSFLKGLRPTNTFQESPGTHHLIITDTDEQNKHLIGKRIAIPICVPQILDSKGVKTVNYLPISVATVFKGRVAIRDKYIKQAERDACGVSITHDKQTMKLSPSDIKSPIARSGPFPDQFKLNSYHYLYYYKWTPENLPNIPQAKLL